MLFPARFVDRERELEALREWCSRSRVTPLYIYGPEGSGKTRLLKEFTLRLKEHLGGDSIAVYITLLKERVLRTHYSSQNHYKSSPASQHPLLILVLSKPRL
jgi:AAA+ ATPase superfamily predicted ATPase